MTGPERIELASSMEFVRDALARIENKVDSLDDRVQKMELKDATAVAVAATTSAIAAADSARDDRRAVSIGRMFAIMAAAAAVGASLAEVIHTLHFI